MVSKLIGSQGNFTPLLPNKVQEMSNARRTILVLVVRHRSRHTLQQIRLRLSRWWVGSHLNLHLHTHIVRRERHPLLNYRRSVSSTPKVFLTIGDS